jgi:sugar phosphate isomerase/epimerase
MNSEDFRYGIFSWYGYRTPILERFRNICEAGFESTMLWWGDEKAFDELDKKELVQETRAQGLFVENIHVPFDDANDIWSEESEPRSRVMDKYLEWVDDCSRYEIPIMVMHISRGNHIDKPNGYGLRCIETLVQEGEKKNVKIAIENTRKKVLMEYLLNNIDSDNLCLCYDTSHGVLYDDEDFGLLSMFGDRSACFHISDNDGQYDRHWFVGQGIIDWGRFIDVFPRGYNGVLSAETYPKNVGIDERVFLSDAYKSLSELGSRICRERRHVKTEKDRE